MPIYEYQCNECGVRFERKQSFHDEPVKVCPECKGKVRRLVHATGVIFKGSGFYVNDSKGSRGNLTSSSDKSDKKESAKKDSSEKKASSKKAASKSKSSDSSADE